MNINAILGDLYINLRGYASHDRFLLAGFVAALGSMSSLILFVWADKIDLGAAKNALNDFNNAPPKPIVRENTNKPVISTPRPGGITVTGITYRVALRPKLGSEPTIVETNTNTTPSIEEKQGTPLKRKVKSLWLRLFGKKPKPSVDEKQRTILERKVKSQWLKLYGRLFASVVLVAGFAILFLKPEPVVPNCEFLERPAKIKKSRPRTLFVQCYYKGRFFVLESHIFRNTGL